MRKTGDPFGSPVLVLSCLRGRFVRIHLNPVGHAGEVEVFDPFSFFDFLGYLGRLRSGIPLLRRPRYPRKSKKENGSNTSTSPACPTGLRWIRTKRPRKQDNTKTGDPNGSPVFLMRPCLSPLPRYFQTGSCRAGRRSRLWRGAPRGCPARRYRRPASPGCCPRPGWWRDGGR